MADKKFLSREEAEDLLYDYYYAYENYNEFARRSDYVDWSPENEQKAWKKYYDLEEKIICLLTGENDK